MSTARKFEDLEIWQIAYELVQEVYEVTRAPAFSRDYSMTDQMRRAATSSMTNIAEGFARRSTAEFIRFLDISRSSAAEIQSLLYVAKSQDYISTNQFEKSYETCRVLRFKTGAFIRYLHQYKNSH